MSSRSSRRAAQRRARKLALKQIRSEALTQSPERSDGPPHNGTDDRVLSSAITPAQLAANRTNALLSTGPTSPEGKAKASLNAVKTALTGRTVLLPSDDAAEYERFLRAYQEEFQPVGQRESDLVQSIADTVWRLRRIPGLELAIYARGRIEFAAQLEEHDPALRDSMIELTTYTVYEKQLRNLHVQEARLARRREKETAELRRLQEERKAKEAEKAKETEKEEVTRLDEAAPLSEPKTPKNGFEFSTAEIKPPRPRPATPNRTCDSVLVGTGETAHTRHNRPLRADG